MCRDEKWGWIDWVNNLVIPTAWDELRPVDGSETLVEACLGEKWSVVTNQGEIVLKPEWDSLDSGYDCVNHVTPSCTPSASEEPI